MGRRIQFARAEPRVVLTEAALAAALAGPGAVAPADRHAALADAALVAALADPRVVPADAPLSAVLAELTAAAPAGRREILADAVPMAAPAESIGLRLR
jgi:hypothetical protein